MFSYIYANNNGIQYFIANTKEENTKQQALRLINDMVNEMVYHSAGDGDQTKLASQSVIDAVQTKDVDKAIQAWNNYATHHLNQIVSCHKLSSFEFVE